VKENLLSLREAYKDLSEQLSSPEALADQDNYRKLTREHARVGKQLKVAEKWFHLREQVDNNRALLKTEKDAEVLEMIRDDLETLEPRLDEAEAAFEEALLPHDPNDDRDAILEIRAGTGGDEAALFAEDMARVYLRYAERQGWKTELIDVTEGAQGGFKEVIYGVKGEGAFGMLRWESGVHRVQRVPKTEASGRIHTSAASVAVLSEAEEVDIDIDPEDLEIDVYRSSGPGGQSVNTTDSAVRITHKPSGLVVSCQDEKSQLKNKAKALKVLYARLLDLKKAEQEAKMSQERRAQIGSGDRSAKIRTYNFPQGRVTDHRVKVTLYELDDVLDGGIDPFIDELVAADQERRLGGDDPALAAG
jgi:peptide chain release factor 1